MRIGIVCEGKTDRLVIKQVIKLVRPDFKDVEFLNIQPEDDETMVNIHEQGLSNNGGGWNGVWRWCHNDAEVYLNAIEGTSLECDIIIVQIDGDVARKEKLFHCACVKQLCSHCEEDVFPLQCHNGGRDGCPALVPCLQHGEEPRCYVEHSNNLLRSELNNCQLEKFIFLVPCDSTDAWIVAAYGDSTEVDYESIKDPWFTVISRGKEYHSIRTPGHGKNLRLYEQLSRTIIENWDVVCQRCDQASKFNEDLISIEVKE